MAHEHPEAEAIGTVTHYYSHLSVAAINLDAPLRTGDRVHIKGHTTDFVQPVESMEIAHKSVDRAKPGEDVAIKVTDHVREHDRIYLEE